MKLEEITPKDLNFIVGAMDFLVYDVPDSVSQRDIDTVDTIINTVIMNSQEPDNFNYEYLQNCIDRWYKEINEEQIEEQGA